MRFGAGEYKAQSDNQYVREHNKPSSQDIGMIRKEIHEARQIRDAEPIAPNFGVVDFNHSI